MDTLIDLNATTVCIIHKAGKCQGIFLGDNPFNFTTPVLLAQLSLCSFFAAIFQLFLTPLGESNFVSQTLVGVVFGPSVLGNSHLFADLLFKPQSFYISDTFSFFGVMLFLFLVGVKTDLSIIKRPGKRAVAIGLSTFFVPLFLNLISASTIRRSIPMNPSLHRSLYWVASLQSLSNFHVIVCFLADLKLLNTELGRLAISSSMVSGACSWGWTMILFTAKQSQLAGKKKHTLLLMCMFVIVLLIIVVYILRPIMFWMVRRTADINTIKESFVVWVFVMVLGCAMLGEIIGQHFLFGPMMLGLAVPDGPPLGSALVSKLDSIVSYIMMPIYFVISGARIDFSIIHARTLGVVELLAFLGFVWKVAGTMLPSLYCKMPINDALHLGLIMSTQGIIDVLILSRAAQLTLIDPETYTIMLLSAVVFTATISPIVKFLYKPSQRYAGYKRTLQNTKSYGELRILACIHHEHNTPSIINLIEATNPNPKTPICVYVIHLIELLGRTAPVFISHHRRRKNDSRSNQSDCIIKAFRLYEQQKHGTMVVYPFTAISPYSTMHDEVCGLALDKRVSIVILPFHLIMSSHETENLANAIRAVNRNILRNAPCSVGIFVDRGTMKANIHIMSTTHLYSIGVLFLGGDDDREALAYASRMAKHPNVALKVIHFVEPGKSRRFSRETERDLDAINEFKDDTMISTKKCGYQEETVKDSVDVINVVRNVENEYDLLLVGRHQSSSSPLLEGLWQWNEFPELGFMGDMLVSSDSDCRASVLVLQQQVFVDPDLLESPKYISEDSAAVDIPSAKVWPVL